jgi:hypothetical protein
VRVQQTFSGATVYTLHLIINNASEMYEVRVMLGTFSGKPFAAMSFRVSICPKCVGYPSMWINMSLATFRCLYRVSWSLNAFRRAADSLAMIERSSAAVLQALTALIRSLSNKGVMGCAGGLQTSLNLST